MTWQGKDEPSETNLVFEIEALDQGTVVKAVHRGYGADGVWDKAVEEAEGSWPLALENLESVLTTGIDLRQVSRPILGVLPETLTLERAINEDIGADSGIYLASVLEDGGAAQAGLQKRDVITSIGGMAVSDLDALTTTLSSYRAGDRVHVSYVRGHERSTAMVELKPRPMPEVSFDPQQMVEQVRGEQAVILTDLRQVLAGLSEADAEKRLSVDEWSVKETLAHLSLSERFTQRWFADVIVGTTGGQFGGNPTVVTEMLAMTLAAAPTVDALLKRLENDMAETLALFAALRPEIVALKARYRAMASSLLGDFHARDHVKQIKATIKAVTS